MYIKMVNDSWMYVSTPPFKTSIQNRPSNQNPTCTGLQLCPPHDQKPRNPRVNCHPNGCYHAHRQPPVKVKICENLLGIFGGEVKLLGDLASCFFWGWRAKDATKTPHFRREGIQDVFTWQSYDMPGTSGAMKENPAKNSAASVAYKRTHVILPFAYWEG